MLRVGIVGCGFIGRIHSWALEGLVGGGLVDAAVTHVLDHDRDRAADMARPHDAEVAADLDALLSSVDAVWVCTPTAGHAALVEAAADAGVAVFCEKPLGRDLTEAERVAAALRRVPHQVGLVLRRSPVFVALRDELASGRHGRLMAIVFRDDQCFPVESHYASRWRADVAEAGSGTLLEHSIHDLDLLRWLADEPVAVAGRTACFAGHDGIEDLGAVDLTYPGGAVASLVSVWHNVSTRPSTRRVEVFCEDAFLWTDDDHLGPLRVETSAGGSTLAGQASEWADGLGVAEEFRALLSMYAAPAKDFLDDLAAGRAPTPGGGDALAAHRLVDLAYRSAAEGGRPLEVTFVP